MTSLITFCTQHPTFFLLCTAWFGLIAGSFLNVVIHRLPLMLEREWASSDGEELPAFNLWVPRSHCTHCGHQIRIQENIPVFSYLFLRGRCAACRTPISPRYPLVEAGTALLSVFVVLCHGPTGQSAGLLLLVWTLIALALIDQQSQLLPDRLTLPLLWAGLLLNLWSTFVPLREAVVGAMAGYLSLWALFWIMKLATGRESLGYGDFKLLAALGAWFGWHALPGILLLAAVLALAGQLPAWLRGTGTGRVFPFGPGLAGAAITWALCGPWLAQWPAWRLISLH